MNDLRARAWVLAVAATMSLGMAAGCKKAAAPQQNADGTVTNANGSVTVPANQAAQRQGTLNSDGSITNADGSVTYPPNSTVAEREKAQATAQTQPNGPPPAPGAGPVTTSNNAPAISGAAAPPAAPAPLSVPAGKDVSIRTTETLSASRNEVGDRFHGVLAAPITVHGEVVFAAGTPVAGEVVSSKGKGRFKGAGDLGISVTEIGRDQVETNVYEREGKGRGKRTAGFIGGGAGLGALIGGLAGGGKGALIGGLAGAGGGTAADAYTGNRDVVIPSESRITFRLTRPINR